MALLQNMCWPVDGAIKCPLHNSGPALGGYRFFFVGGVAQGLRFASRIAGAIFLLGGGAHGPSCLTILHSGLDNGNEGGGGSVSLVSGHRLSDTKIPLICQVLPTIGAGHLLV